MTAGRVGVEIWFGQVGRRVRVWIGVEFSVRIWVITPVLEMRWRRWSSNPYDAEFFIWGKCRLLPQCRLGICSRLSINRSVDVVYWIFLGWIFDQTNDFRYVFYTVFGMSVLAALMLTVSSCVKVDKELSLVQKSKLPQEEVDINSSLYECGIEFITEYETAV